MITTRTAKQCGQADYGWLQARYTFSFGHYFDPTLLGYASLRVLNQEVLAPGASNHAGWRRKRPLRLITDRPDKRSAIGQHAAPTTCRGVIINALYWP